MKTLDQNKPNGGDNGSAAAENDAFLNTLTAIGEEFEGKGGETATAAAEDSTLTAHKESPLLHLPEVPPALTATEASNHFANLLLFFLSGIRPKAYQKQDYRIDRLTPVLLHAYRDATAVRYHFPLFLSQGAEGLACQPLKSLVDKLAETHCAADDEGQRLKRILLAVESRIKSQLDQSNTGSLKQQWQTAADAVLSTLNLTAERRKDIAARLNTIAETLPDAGELYACHPRVPLLLLQNAQQSAWDTHATRLAKEMHELIFRLEGLLGSEAQPDDPGRTEDRSGAALSDPALGELDADIFAEIVSESQPVSLLPEPRRERIRAAREVIAQMQKKYGLVEPGSGRTGAAENAPVRTCREALNRYYERRADLTAFFKAVRIARLEVDNRYREDKHDPYFAGFNEHYLNHREMTAFPPVILHLQSGSLNDADKALLIEILASDMPVKVLFQIDQICESAAAVDPSLNSHPGRQDSLTEPHTNSSTALALNAWTARLPQMALNLQNSYVFQGTIADPEALLEAYQVGLAFEGPALFAVYHPRHAGDDSLAQYINAAAALEARLLPGFRCQPDLGSGLAERFSIGRTPQNDRRWPENELHYQEDSTTETAMMAFTAADFLAQEESLSSQFLAVPRTDWPPQMLPVSEYLDLSEGKRNEKIPFILMAGEDGLLWRVVPTQDVIRLTYQVAANWQALQELGGINNSHVAAVLAAEKERLETEKAREISDLSEQHHAEMAQTVGQLTEEIVSRIAAGLLSEGSATAMPAAPPVPRPAPKKAPAASPAESPAPAPAEAEVEEEEALSFDEPYIDTPLCTSCNDCINTNKAMFAYNENKQAIIKDINAGTFRQLVEAAEKCPVRIIHPGKPKHPDEPGLEELIKRAEKFN